MLIDRNTVDFLRRNKRKNICNWIYKFFKSKYIGKNFLKGEVLQIKDV